MKSFSPKTAPGRPDMLRAKRIYGLWFGMVLGLTFSLFTWGFDALGLDRMNGLQPWLKFLSGALPCTIIGGIAGWLSAKFEKPLISLLIWVIVAWIFARLTISVPFQIMPRLLGDLEPDLKNLLHYTYYSEAFASRFGVAFVWLLIIMGIAGLLQIPISEPAVFSGSLFGKIVPLLVVLVLMSVAGTNMDNLNNETLRSSVGAVDSAVQYYFDHQGEKIDPATYRQMHLASLRPVENLITPKRAFVVSGYNEYLEQVEVLGRFEQAWVECQVFDNQLVFCKQVGANR